MSLNLESLNLRICRCTHGFRRRESYRYSNGILYGIHTKTGQASSNPPALQIFSLTKFLIPSFLLLPPPLNKTTHVAMDHPESHIGITSLPQELLDNILVRLSTEGISRLGRCNKHLRARLQVALYGPHDTRNQASKWACENGAIDTLAIALSYGAAIDTVDVGTQPFRFKTFTVHLAAKHRQVDMFDYLISGGARVDDPAVKRTQVEAFVRCLCRPGNANMMRRFAEAGLTSHLCQYLKNMLLLGVLESSSPESMQEFGIDANVVLDSVRSLLDAGADPNHVQSLHRSEVSTSVLSAALLSHRPDLFRLLVERGADVNGVPSPGLNHHRLPLHVPVCAAAFIMAAAGEDNLGAVVPGPWGRYQRVCAFYPREVWGCDTRH